MSVSLLCLRHLNRRKIRYKNDRIIHFNLKDVPTYATATASFAILSSSARVGLLSAGSFSIRVAAIDGVAVPFALINVQIGSESRNEM